MFWHLLLLLLANLAFAIAPLFVKDLQGLSVFSMTFLRFFFATLVEILLFLVYTYYIYYNLKRKKYNKSYWRYLKIIIRSYYLEPNPKFFHGRSQLGYTIFLGFLLCNLSAPFYFLSYITAGVVISTIMVNSLTLILIAIGNWLRKEEEFDLLKILDLTLLIAAVFTIAYSNYSTTHAPLQIGTLALIGTVIIAYTTFLSWMGKDKNVPAKSLDKIITEDSFSLHIKNTLKKKEKNSEKRKNKVRIDSLNPYDLVENSLKYIHALLKLIGIHLFGSLLLIPFCLILWGMEPNSIVGLSAKEFIINDLPKLGILITNPSILGLIIICTIFPYFGLIYAANTWPKGALAYDGWASIFTLIDPLTGLYIGYFVWSESIRPDYLLFTTLFLVTGIFLRYFHETANTQRGIFVVKLQHGYIEEFLHLLQTIKEVTAYQLLVGTYDVAVRFLVRSMAQLNYVADKINYFHGVAKAYYTLENPCL